MIGLLASCAGDESRHVYRSSPPVRDRSPAAAPSSAPEPPVGTNGPSARITAVLSTSTGTAARLDRVEGDINVVTLVSRGSGSPSQGPATLQLRITGSTDTTLVQRFDTPVPVIVAHSFRVRVSDGAAGLRDGRFHLQVRLVGRDGQLIASSIPVDLGVRVERTGDAVGP